MAIFGMPRQIALDGNGDPMAGAKLTFYDAGTTDLKNTYSDIGLSSAHTNPVIADANGVFPTIFLKEELYKISLSSSADVLEWTQDNVSGGGLNNSYVTLQMLANGTPGGMIAFKKTSGEPVEITPGELDTVLMGNGVDRPPSMKNLHGITKEWSKAQTFAATTLTDEAAIDWNLEDNQVAEVTLTDNRTLNAPTNMKDGGTYILRVKQDATGGRALAFASAYKFPGGSVPTLTSDANALDIFTFISDGTLMHGAFLGDSK